MHLESLSNGLEAIDAMKKDRERDPERFKVEADFGCQNAICGV